jgi:hypothetical protein
MSPLPSVFAKFSCLLAIALAMLQTCRAQIMGVTTLRSPLFPARDTAMSSS